MGKHFVEFPADGALTGGVAFAFDVGGILKQREHTGFAVLREGVQIEQAIVSSLMLRVDGMSAAAIVNALNGQGIAAHRMYLPPLYHHPYFANLDVVSSEGTALPGTVSLEKKIGLMRNSEAVHRSVFGLPFHAFLSEGDIAHVIKAIDEIMEAPAARRTA